MKLPAELRLIILDLAFPDLIDCRSFVVRETLRDLPGEQSSSNIYDGPRAIMETSRQFAQHLSDRIPPIESCYFSFEDLTVPELKEWLLIFGEAREAKMRRFEMSGWAVCGDCAYKNLHYVDELPSRNLGPNDPTSVEEMRTAALQRRLELPDRFHEHLLYGRHTCCCQLRDCVGSLAPPFFTPPYLDKMSCGVSGPRMFFCLAHPYPILESMIESLPSPPEPKLRSCAGKTASPTSRTITKNLHRSVSGFQHVCRRSRLCGQGDRLSHAYKQRATSRSPILAETSHASNRSLPIPIGRDLKELSDKRLTSL